MVDAFQRDWFFVGTLGVGALYGLGGIVHLGNMFGFGEVQWSESPLSWKIGDIWWGVLDIATVVGIIGKSPYGLLALILAAGSQVVVCSLTPELFAVTAEQRTTLQGLVYFNAAVLIVLGLALYGTTRDGGT